VEEDAGFVFGDIEDGDLFVVGGVGVVEGEEVAVESAVDERDEDGGDDAEVVGGFDAVVEGGDGVVGDGEGVAVGAAEDEVGG
jgi:hypothetical protein